MAPRRNLDIPDDTEVVGESTRRYPPIALVATIAFIALVSSFAYNQARTAGINALVKDTAARNTPTVVAAAAAAAVAGTATPAIGSLSSTTALPRTPVAVAPPLATVTSSVVLFSPGDNGYKFDVNTGVAYYGEQTHGRWSPWVGPSRLLVTWLSKAFDGPRIHDGYLLNLQTGALEHLPGYTVHTPIYSRPDGKRVVLMDIGDDSVRPRILLSNLETGAAELVYDADGKQPQWAAPDLLGPVDQFGLGNAWWVSQDVFIVEAWISDPTATPPASFYQTDDPGYHPLLVNIATHTVSLLPRGFVVAYLPDGAVVLSRDTLAGEELLLVSTPYAAAPRSLTSPGSWISSVVLSPDGRRLAWIESDPGSANLAHQHMSCFEGCGFKIRPLAIGLWDSASDKLSKISLTDKGWNQHRLSPDQAGIAWTVDNNALLYRTALDGPTAGLFRITLDGTATELARQPAGLATTDVRVSVEGQGNDGSIYYSISEYRVVGSTDSLLVIKPDGATVLLYQAGDYDAGWHNDRSGQIIIYGSDALQVLDMANGMAKQIALPIAALGLRQDDIKVSADGQWLAYYARTKYDYMTLPDSTDPHLALRILKLR